MLHSSPIRILWKEKNQKNEDSNDCNCCGHVFLTPASRDYFLFSKEIGRKAPEGAFRGFSEGYRRASFPPLFLA
jgi:hypothetical protein